MSDLHTEDAKGCVVLMTTMVVLFVLLLGLVLYAWLRP